MGPRLPDDLAPSGIRSRLSATTASAGGRPDPEARSASRDHRPARCRCRRGSHHARPASAARLPRAAGPVIQRLSPLLVAMQPSKRDAEFSVTQGSPCVMALAKPAMISRASLCHQSALDRDTRRAQPGDAAALHARVGIMRMGDDHAGDTGRDQCIGTGWGPAMMRTGLQRDIGGRAARRLSGIGQCHDFGMGTAAGLRRAAPDDDIALRDNAADCGIGRRGAKRRPRQRQGLGHKTRGRFPSRHAIGKRRERRKGQRRAPFRRRSRDRRRR